MHLQGLRRKPRCEVSAPAVWGSPEMGIDQRFALRRAGKLCGDEGMCSWSEAIRDDDFRLLLRRRSAILSFAQDSEAICRETGIGFGMYELLLAIRATSRFGGPSLGSVARSLCLKPSTVVGMVNEAVDRGLVSRTHDRWDHRVVRLSLTQEGEGIVRPLAEWHLSRWCAFLEELEGVAGGPERTRRSTR